MSPATISAKLVTGSFGSLAAIVSATFKLSPLPAASKTLTMTVADTTALARDRPHVMSSQLEPIAFEVTIRGQRRPPSSQNGCLRLASSA